MLVGRKPLTVTVAPDITKRDSKPVIPPRANNGVNLPRSMQQLYADSPGRPILKFSFPMAISSFQHEVPAVAYEELARPLSLPLLDTSGAQLHKVSIEFVVVRPQDGVQTPIEDQIATLRDMAASDTPVVFANVHDALKGSWKISAMSFSITRTDELGKAVMANASMSLTESTDRLERFVTLPKFSYSVPRGSSTTTTTTTGGGEGNSEAAWYAFNQAMGDKYTITNATRSTVNTYIQKHGGNAVKQALAQARGNENSPATLVDFIIKAFAPKTPQS